MSEVALPRFVDRGDGPPPLLGRGCLRGLEAGARRPQHEPGDFGRAADAERVLGGDPLADGHQRPSAAEEAEDETALRMGTTRNQYVKLERGERRLSDVWIDRAAKAFEVDAGERHVYSIGLDGGNLTRLTTAIGAHTAEISPDETVIANAYQGAYAPYTVYSAGG